MLPYHLLMKIKQFSMLAMKTDICINLYIHHIMPISYFYNYSIFSMQMKLNCIFHLKSISHRLPNRCAFLVLINEIIIP